ncbi:MAG: serine protease [Bryobacteraceae bacterium]|nr:serine protease [Bryobacteraceae bacterium]
MDAELNVKAVPKHVLQVTRSTPDRQLVLEVTTDFDGRAEVSLPAGEYRVQSKASLDFQRKTYRWDLPLVVQAQPVSIELSNDNARIGAAEGPSPTRVIDSLTTHFRSLQAAVFTVWSEFGHGTGFLIDKDGLIVTNQHVIGPSRHISVQFDERRRIPAVLLASDSEKDVAVLWADVSSIEDVIVAPIATDDVLYPPAVEGERVFTIGSPLSQRKIMTSGIVSRVEERAIISDININQGNSGGPLFNSTGKVIGIATFGEGGGMRPGPGISGIVRIEEAKTTIAKAREKMPRAARPEKRFLPVEPTERFPIESVKATLALEKFDSRPYLFSQGDFEIAVITPVLKYRLQAAGEMQALKEKKKRSKNAEIQGTFQPLDDLRSWAEYAGGYRPTIMIRATPKLHEGFWSGLNRGLAANQGIITQAKLRFKNDFYRMDLLCGDKVVEPIHPSKVAHVVNERNRLVDITDATYEGLYTYSPDAIAPSCGSVVLKVYTEKEPDKAQAKVLDRKTVDRVWSDFATYRSTGK